MSTRHAPDLHRPTPLRRLAGRRGPTGRHRRRTTAAKVYGSTYAAVAATAVLGAAAVDPDSRWYRTLRKPSWQPPSWSFGAVWTPLYAGLAWSAGHALLRTPPTARPALAGSFAANLALNAGWNWLFFGARNPRAGLAGTTALLASDVQLIARVARHDRTAATALFPYAAWTAFATALNLAIVRRNRG
ncbi:TspO/MBR family protein [Streptomyces sp. NPDC060194]|uniref:TspO/MBR family protein n=1 Tax=Streptomyces sp. NPDC060194 TaxID=3347069 RepID=UPI0036486A80